MKCPNCGTMNPDDNLFCEECGEKLEMPKLTCPECGKEQKKDNPKFCPFCGYRFQAQPMVGDKNVIAGDVVSDSHDTIHHTTVYSGVTPGDALIECYVCGKLINKASGEVFRCRACKQYVCSECYDRDTRLCHECIDDGSVKLRRRVARPELAAFEYEELENGKVTLLALKGKRVMSISIPSCVESIADSCFEGSNIVDVAFEEGLVSIGKRAFADCKSLFEIQFPSSLKIISPEAFSGCIELSAEIPSSCRVGKNAFKGTPLEKSSAKPAAAKKKAAKTSDDDFTFEDTGLDQSLYEIWNDAMNGDGGAANEIGIAYINGEGAPQSAQEAVKWFRVGAELGNAIAQSNLAFSYETGNGVPQSDQDAAKWYFKAAEQGNLQAIRTLGVFFEVGRGVEQSHAKAVSFFIDGAQQGDAICEAHLADHLQSGLGIDQSFEEAFHWLYKSAEQGFALAQYNVAMCYKLGIGVEKSKEDFLFWLEKSVDSGDPDGQYLLGQLFRGGDGVPLSDEKAAELFYAAAQQGHPEAQFSIGTCFANGVGVEASYEDAIYWFQEAAKRDNPDAQQILNKLGIDW